MNDKPEIKVGYVTPLKKICMTIGELPSSYLETMTYYEMLVWFTEFLKNKVIPTVDNNAEAVQELQGLYEELRTYVNDYFDNLDVQEEINNKLDEMAESGQLTDIIAQYLGLAGMITFDTVADMKLAENLVNGSKCQTLGYYSVNDGGGAVYRITSTESQSEYQEEVGSLYATLIIENDINVKQFGAKGDGTTDDTTNIQTAINYSDNKKINFVEGTYIISTHLTMENKILIGNNAIIKTSSGKADNLSNKMLNPSGSLTLKGIKFDANNTDYTIIPNTQLIYLNIDNCEFTGVKQNTRQDGLSLNSAVNSFAKESIITDSNIHDNVSHGLMIGSSVVNSRLYVNNCKFNNNGEDYLSLGLVSYNEQVGSNFESVVIKNCEANGNGASGIAPHTLYNVIVDSCVANNNGEHGFCLMDGKNGIITNCTAHNNAVYGIRVQGDYSGVINPHYDNFKLLNNDIIGKCGISASYNMNGGLIKNNTIVVTGNPGDPGINLIRNRNDEFSGSYKKVVIENNNITTERYYDSITSFIQIEDSNIIQNNIINGQIKDGYYVNSIWYGTPNKLKYGTTNNIIDYPTDFSQWTQGGFSRDGNTFTINGAENTVCRKITNITANTRFITVFLDFGNSNVSSLDLLGLLIRFRHDGTLLNYTRGHLTSNQYGVIRKNFAKKSAILIDLNEFDFGENVVNQAEVFIKAKSTEQEIPLTINGVYMALSSELPILPNEM